MITLEDQLTELIDRLYQRASAVFVGCTPDDPRIILDAYLNGLSRPEDAGRIAGRIGRCLVDQADLECETFWQTPLGRQLAWHVGYPYDRCPGWLVGAIIGTSRQYGHRATSGWEISRDARGRRYVPTTEVRKLVRSREARRPAPPQR